MTKFSIYYTLVNANGGVLDARLDTYLTTIGFSRKDDEPHTALDQGPEWQSGVVSGFYRIVANHNGKARLIGFKVSAHA